MKEQIDNVIEFLKNQEIRGCITGSIMLGYFPDSNQDVDVFVYDDKSFIKLLFAMHYNPMFVQLDEIEKWKFEKETMSTEFKKKRNFPTSIKFKYNTCIDVNVILKGGCDNIFAVLSSFDLDIVCKGYDIQTKQFLDLSENLPNKKATWNKWNIAFHEKDLWQVSRILRQLERCFKYANKNRGYNTDEVVLKYIELIDYLQEVNSIFSSEKYDEKLNQLKENTKIVKDICLVWLETHSITKEEIELLQQKVKEI